MTNMDDRREWLKSLDRDELQRLASGDDPVTVDQEALDYYTDYDRLRAEVREELDRRGAKTSNVGSVASSPVKVSPSRMRAKTSNVRSVTSPQDVREQTRNGSDRRQRRERRKRRKRRKRENRRERARMARQQAQERARWIRLLVGGALLLAALSSGGGGMEEER